MRIAVVAFLLLVISCKTYPNPEDVRNFHWTDRVPVSSTIVGQNEVSIAHAPSSAVSILFTNFRVDLQPSSTDLGATSVAAMSLPLDPGRVEATPPCVATSAGRLN